MGAVRRHGGVSGPPGGTAEAPPRPRLRQWVAVSAASETACRRAAVHPPACWPPVAQPGTAPHRVLNTPANDLAKACCAALAPHENRHSGYSGARSSPRVTLSPFSAPRSTSIGASPDPSRRAAIGLEH